MGEVFKAPEFKLEPMRVAEIPFRGAIAAGAHLSLNSGLITYPFRIAQVKMIFTDDANNWIQHRWYTNRGMSAPTTGPPAGVNIFGRESPTADFIGKGVIRVVPCNIEYPEGGLRIILYTFNNGPYAYQINASVTLEAL